MAKGFVVGENNEGDRNRYGRRCSRAPTMARASWSIIDQLHSSANMVRLINVMGCIEPSNYYCSSSAPDSSRQASQCKRNGRNRSCAGSQSGNDSDGRIAQLFQELSYDVSYGGRKVKRKLFSSEAHLAVERASQAQAGTCDNTRHHRVRSATNSHPQASAPNLMMAP